MVSAHLIVQSGRPMASAPDGVRLSSYLVSAPSDPLGGLTALEGVPSAYAATRDGIDVLLRDRGLRRTTPDLTGESLLVGAHASAVLEGSGSSLEEVRDGAGDEIARDSIRLSTQVLSVAPLLGSAPLQALARLHSLAAAGALEEDRLGRPRDSASAKRLQSLAGLLVTPTRAPALLVAAIVHAELATAAPFPSHNGLVARAVERLVLVARGVDEKSLIAPEVGHYQLRRAYEGNLRMYGEGGRAGVQAWLLYSAEAFTKAAEASPLDR